MLPIFVRFRANREKSAVLMLFIFCIAVARRLMPVDTPLTFIFSICIKELAKVPILFEKRVIASLALTASACNCMFRLSIVGIYTPTFLTTNYYYFSSYVFFSN